MLPPDIQTRALAVQAAATLLGKSGYVMNPVSTYPSETLKQLTAELVVFIRTGNWPGRTEEDTPA